MTKIEEILEFVRKTNPYITKEKLISELEKSEYSAKSLIVTLELVK